LEPWLIYLPPTMSPCETSKRDGLLEHPEEGFAYYLHEDVHKVVCQQKHMGSRAVVVDGGSSMTPLWSRSGGEGMVVKPLEFVAKGRKELVQPAVKVRGRENTCGSSIARNTRFPRICGG
jgi:hypothetical protein